MNLPQDKPVQILSNFEKIVEMKIFKFFFEKINVY